MAKPKVSFYWCASCGGCEEAVVDLNEFILNVIDAVDVVFWPVALDFKKKDIEGMADGEITATFINGAVRTGEQEEMCRLLRKKSKLVFSFGACSNYGGVPGLANFFDREKVLQRVYFETESTVNPEKKYPKTKSVVDGKELKLPGFFNRVYPMNRLIPIDYYIPGCPPTAKVVRNAIELILKNGLPAAGSVLTENKSLCKDCERNSTKPDKISIKEFKRVHQVMDNGKCFLEQGLICLGISTRTGCEASCIKANMPCRGCFGKTNAVLESGAKGISAIASMLDLDEEKEITRAVDSIADAAGLFYRYSLAASILNGKKIVVRKD